MKDFPHWLYKGPEIVATSNNFIVADFETIGRKEAGIALFEENEAYCLAWKVIRDGTAINKVIDDMDQIGDFYEDLCRADFSVFHNADYDVSWLLRLTGLHLEDHLFLDTAIAQYILSSQTMKWPSLEDSCAANGINYIKDSVGKCLRTGVTIDYMPKSLVIQYCQDDVNATYELFLKQRKQMVERKQVKVFYTRCLCIGPRVDIQQNGNTLDSKEVLELQSSLVEKIQRMEFELNQKAKQEINWRSAKQRSEIFYDVIKLPVPKIRGEEKRTTSITEVDKLKPRNKNQKEFISLFKAWSEANALLTKTVNKCVECVNDAIKANRKPKLHFQIIATGTGTMRYASKGIEYGIQGQNYPKSLKYLLIASDQDNWCYDGDAPQIEFRAAIDMAKDPIGMNDLETGFDVHSFSAATVFGEDYDTIVAKKDTDDYYDKLRFHGKAYSFRPLYGGGETKETNGYVVAFRERYSQIELMQQGWCNSVINTNEVILPTGARMRWDKWTIRKDGEISVKQQVYNYGVQYMATGEWMPLATYFLWLRFRCEGLKTKLVNMVHDSAPSEGPKVEKDVVKQCYEKAFDEDVVFYFKEVYDYEIQVPLGVDFKYGKSWGKK